MKTSLETMAKSRARYTDSSKPKSQPLLRVSSPITKSPADRKKSSSSEASVVSSEKSSSNYQYDTPNEEPPPPHNPASRPLNQIANYENLDPKISETRKNDFEVNESERMKETTIDIPERSVSFPVMRKNLPCDFGLRVASESLNARMEKLQGIMSVVESIGMSRSDLDVSNVDSTNLPETLSISEHAEFIYSAPDDRQSGKFFNRTKGVKFLALNAENRQPEMPDSLTLQHCRVDKLRKDTSCKRETIDDLIGIAENRNPSIKSIYFPPNPDDTSIMSELCDNSRDSRNSRVSSRYRTDLDALSRIQDELEPLQDKFTELAGQVRALNLTGMHYGLPVDPWIESVRPASIISHDASGYFLHRARVFCRNDSPRYASTGNSRMTVLPIVDNSLPVTFDRRISHLWHDNRDSDYLSDYSRPLKNSVQTLREFNDYPVRSRNNEFYEVKSYGNGRELDTRRSDQDRSMSMMMINDQDRSRHDHLEDYHWSQASTLLPIDGNRKFHENFAPSADHSTGSFTHRVVSAKSSIVRSNDVDHSRRGSRDDDPCITDGKILPPANDENRSYHHDRESPRASRRNSFSHRLSDGRLSIDRSRTSQFTDRSSRDPRMTSDRRVSREKVLSREISYRNVIGAQEECRRFKKSAKYLSRSRESRDSLNDRGRNNEKNHRHRDRVCSKKRHDHRVSRSFDKTPENSGSLNVQTKTSIISYSRVFKPSSSNLEIADNNDLADREAIKFTGTYTERTIVKMDKSLDVSDSPLEKVLSVWKITDSRESSSSSNHRREFDETRTSQDNERQLILPISEEKITIVPVIYTSGIPESFDQFDRTICRRTKRSSNRRRSGINNDDNSDDRYVDFSTRNSSIVSFDTKRSIDPKRSIDFPGQSNRLHAGNSSLYEKSHERHSHRDNRLTIAYDRSNTEISVSSSSSTINTDRTIRSDVTSSTMIISQRPKSSTTKKENNNSPRNLRIDDSSKIGSRRTSNRTIVSSARSRNNRVIIGTRISPDQFTDDA